MANKIILDDPIPDNFKYGLNLPSYEWGQRINKLGDWVELTNQLHKDNKKLINAREKIIQLEAENKKLYAENIELRDIVARYFVSLNRINKITKTIINPISMNLNKNFIACNSPKLSLFKRFLIKRDILVTTFKIMGNKIKL